MIRFGAVPGVIALLWLGGLVSSEVLLGDPTERPGLSPAYWNRSSHGNAFGMGQHTTEVISKDNVFADVAGADSQIHTFGSHNLYGSPLQRSRVGHLRP